MNITQLLHKIINSVLIVENEINCIKRFIKTLHLTPNHKVLDVGCGYGNKLLLLREFGLDVLGVEVNSAIVAKNLESGINCVTVEEFNSTSSKYDLILMSHVIEHFPPHDLLPLMDSYLDRLNMGGFLIIVTPLFSPYFYEDFDHVKPYHPTSINMVFCSDDAQVQFYSRNRLKLINLWFRRGPLKNVFMKDIYIPGLLHISIIINVISALIFKASFGLIGRIDGWIGVYRKLSK